nr:hypothetical protein [Tanacetum cinerariifolium]
MDNDDDVEFVPPFSIDHNLYEFIPSLAKIPHMLHLEGNFLKSRGYLLFACRDDVGSIEFNIYEMMKGSSVWSVSSVVLRKAFDPRKSLYYKVVQAGRTSGEIEI